MIRTFVRAALDRAAHGWRRPRQSGACARTKADRARAERRGRWGEDVAALWLQAKGFQVLAHRVRTRSGEVDLLARRGGVVAAVEVKTRSRAEAAYDAVSRRSQKRIARAAAAWLAARPGLAALERRFDLVIVAPWRLPVHVRDAWRAESWW